ncbi:hypothetical protein B0J17DRAFT_385811 [Rhizoctonia solani]|nr:hypothetical protein B0J17DRAFT_385811 [Rhizoctonia solani]
MMLSALLTCFISIIYVQAFVITQPDSTGWPRNVGMMTVRWDTSPSDPPVFAMLLRDASQLSVVNPLAVALGSFELNLPTVPVSQTYQLLFVDPRNLTRILAISSIFPISNSNSTTTSSSETVTRSTFTITVTLSSPPLSSIPPTTSLAPSSTTPPTSSGTSNTATTLSTPASETRFTTSTLGTIVPPVTVTVTVPPNSDASFVPINAAGRPRGIGNWVGAAIIAMVSFHLGGL